MPEATTEIYATGKRKTAIARVRIKPGTGQILVNGRTMAEYFPREVLHMRIQTPFEVAGVEQRYDVVARIAGGGIAGQADALRHGISRALEKADEALRQPLKRRGLLTRDARKKERKKYGQKVTRRKQTVVPNVQEFAFCVARMVLIGTPLHAWKQRVAYRLIGLGNQRRAHGTGGIAAPQFEHAPAKTHRHGRRR